ncbi:MAG: hypothetical protein ACXWF8_12510 [Methylobacter sp.]
MITPLYENKVLFDLNIPEPVNRLLQAGVTAHRADKELAESLFKQAQQLDRRCLQTYFALYKFYFYQKRLHEAEREAIAALQEAAWQGRFPSDYRHLARVGWNMYGSEISLFYLYTLKALAFIKLRKNQETEAKLILSLLQTLDPEDRCGGSVIAALADALDLEAA